MSLAHIFQVLIRVYQRLISPDHSWVRHLRRYPTCRFSPTCSQFAHTAIGRYGVPRGSWMTLRRLLRCTPWHAGGHDPVP